uniref:Uncharacterized protein n=1 Tax=Percolomonas cosmopolitus TaxID=63605 RepID=A0A7S1KT95_9EUKA|mmetsp:Transcript_6191/g.23391  ORF Transcript_6191/g.23391 Transcript_6191/m.23391 type:complete len:161 (+) Transcript_6191:245-727(+)|eukprot:CAMPEP_0117439922 /NCGR_PEP_ID=MMETSP0759-20121206/2811_1 /TAXON_ID=63605 /ORGANISM="Percolomonas cosmopolitus, Strain WS" /LENGTH=160 /DNA_ID=CAMNT_0005231645 /DNA_START=335 /DNA_END=817 /DNA_ORIENTATION=+
MNPCANPNNPTDAERVTVLINEHKLKRRSIDSANVTDADVTDADVLQMNAHANTARQGIPGVEALLQRFVALERRIQISEHNMPIRMHNMMYPSDLRPILVDDEIPPHWGEDGRMKISDFMRLSNDELVEIIEFYELQDANTRDTRRARIARHLGFSTHL